MKVILLRAIEGKRASTFAIYCVLQKDLSHIVHAFKWNIWYILFRNKFQMYLYCIFNQYNT